MNQDWIWNQLQFINEFRKQKDTLEVVAATKSASSCSDLVVDTNNSRLEIIRTSILSRSAGESNASF